MDCERLPACFIYLWQVNRLVGLEMCTPIQVWKLQTATTTQLVSDLLPKPFEKISYIIITS
jgi:hypothetical protein